MEYLNRDYEFMSEDIATFAHPYAVRASKASEVQLALLDMTTARIAELYPDKTCKTYQAGDFDILDKKQKQLDFSNPMSQENLSLIPHVIPLGNVEFEWDEKTVLALGVSRDNLYPSVSVKAFPIAWTFNPVMNAKTRFVNPNGPIVEMFITVTGMCQLILHKEYRIDDPETNKMFELFKQLSAIPGYAKQFDIFKEGE